MMDSVSRDKCQKRENGKKDGEQSVQRIAFRQSCTKVWECDQNQWRQRAMDHAQGGKSYAQIVQPIDPVNLDGVFGAPGIKYESILFHFKVPKTYLKVQPRATNSNICN